MWARAKDATKKGKQKWRVGDLLADERFSPAVSDSLRSTHACWEDGSTGGGNLGR